MIAAKERCVQENECEDKKANEGIEIVHQLSVSAQQNLRSIYRHGVKWELVIYDLTFTGDIDI